MRSPGTIALAVATPLIIGVSLLLPDLVSLMQDQRNAADVVRYESRTVELDLAPSGDPTATLELLTRDHQLIPADEGAGSSKGKARAALQELLDGFEEDGLVGFNLDGADFQERSVLAMDVSESRTTLLWRCAVVSTDEDARVFVAYIDDASGAVVSLFFSQSEDELASIHHDPTDPSYLDALTKAWAEHLGVELAQPIPNDQSDEAAVSDPSGTQSIASATTASSDAFASIFLPVQSSNVILIGTVDEYRAGETFAKQDTSILDSETGMAERTSYLIELSPAGFQ